MKARKLTRALGASSTVPSRSLVALWLVLAGAGRAHGQAEPAPEGYEPPPGVPISIDPATAAAEHEAMARRWIIAVQPRLVVALGNGGGSGLPRLGFGAGVSAGRALLVRGRLRLGLGFSFSYERQQRERRPPPTIESGDTTQSLSHAAFSLDVRIDGLALGGRVRPWALLGPALSVASYGDPPSAGSPLGVAEVQVLPALRAGLGIGVEVGRGIEVGPRVEWLATFSSRPVGTPAVSPFSPGNFSAGIDVGFRF